METSLPVRRRVNNHSLALAEKVFDNGNNPFIVTKKEHDDGDENQDTENNRRQKGISVVQCDVIIDNTKHGDDLNNCQYKKEIVLSFSHFFVNDVDVHFQRALGAV